MTARISGRSHLIQEKEAKTYNSLYVGVGGQLDSYPSHAPLPQVGGIPPKIGGSAISPHVTPRTHEGPAKCLRVARQGVMWPVWWGVKKSDFFKYSSINSYLKKLILQERGANACPYLTLMSKSAYLLSMSCEKRISCILLYSVRAYKMERGRLFFLRRHRYILQATSLQKTVNIKNKAGHNSTHGTVSSLLFSRWKVLLHTVYISNIFYVDWG